MNWNTKIGLADLGWMIGRHLSAVQNIDVWNRFGVWFTVPGQIQKQVFRLNTCTNKCTLRQVQVTCNDQP